MSNILVLGGTSFIGRNILDELKDKYDIIDPSRSTLDLLKNDILSYIKEYTPDILLYMANNKDFKSNLVMYYNVMRHSRRFKKIIYLGSGAEYDKSRSLNMINEDDFGNYQPLDAYGLSKHIMSVNNMLLGNVIHLRLFGVYGKGEQPQRFITYCIDRVKNKRRIEIKNDVLFSYVYVEDLAEVIDKLIVRDTKHQVYNVTPDKPARLSDIAKIVDKISGGKNSIISLNSGDGLNYTGSNKRLQSEFNFKFTSLEEGIRKMYEKDLLHNS